MTKLNLEGFDPIRVAAAQEVNRLAEQAAGFNEGWQREYMPRVLPNGWRLTQECHDGAMYQWKRAMSVILTCSLEQDGRKWLHVSASCDPRVPTWEELKLVKAIFVGPKRYAYQVLPPEAQYININPTVLHLFACLDDHNPPMPDFTHGGTSL